MNEAMKLMFLWAPRCQSYCGKNILEPGNGFLRGINTSEDKMKKKNAGCFTNKL